MQGFALPLCARSESARIHPSCGPRPLAICSCMALGAVGSQAGLRCSAIQPRVSQAYKIHATNNTPAKRAIYISQHKQLVVPAVHGDGWCVVVLSYPARLQPHNLDIHAREVGVEGQDRHARDPRGGVGEAIAEIEPGIAQAHQDFGGIHAALVQAVAVLVQLASGPCRRGAYRRAAPAITAFRHCIVRHRSGSGP